MMARLTIHNTETASEDVKARVEHAAKANGFLPNLVGVLANAPAAIAFYQDIGKLNATTSLTPAEREVVQIISAKINSCHFCLAGHSKIATWKKLLSENNISAAREADASAFDDEKLAALATFTVAVLTRKGAISSAELNAFLAAGYNEQQAVEVVVGLALATLSNFTNNLARTELNPELQDFA